MSFPGTKQRLAFLRASWHDDMVGNAADACRSTLIGMGFAGKIDEIHVPGSLEIPLLASKLGRTGKFDAIIAFGFVVDGGIYRHDFVARAVIDGLVRAGMETDTPVLSVVLTPHHFHEHDVHTGFFREHMIKKGEEAAHATKGVLDAVELADRIGG